MVPCRRFESMTWLFEQRRKRSIERFRFISNSNSGLKKRFENGFESVTLRCIRKKIREISSSKKLFRFGTGIADYF